MENQKAFQANCHVSNIEQVIDNLNRIKGRLSEAIELLGHKVEPVSLRSTSITDAQVPLEKGVVAQPLPEFFSIVQGHICDTDVLLDELNSVIRGIKL